MTIIKKPAWVIAMEETDHVWYEFCVFIANIKPIPGKTLSQQITEARELSWEKREEIIRRYISEQKAGFRRETRCANRR
jgi:hypothetical protein